MSLKKTTLIELDKRVVEFDKKLKIFKNGFDNTYPEKIDRLINNSVTAKQCANTMAVFLAGKGFGEHNDFKVNKDTTLLKLTHKISQSIARQRGVFVHVNYDLNGEFISSDVIPFAHCRIGKKDGDKYNGKIEVCQDWSDVKNNKITSIDVYNPKKSVITAQFNAQGENYKGQVVYINLDYNVDYPFATIDAVQNDCDSEAQAALYKNRSLRKGFFGKTLVVTKPLVGDKPEDGNELEMLEWTNANTERDNFVQTMKKFIGAENNDGILHMEMEFDDEIGIEKSILFEEIKSNIDDKIFEYTENSTSNNIRFAFNNIPSMLVRDTDGSMFGQSGDGIKQAKLFYQEQTTMERMVLVETIKMIMANFKGFEGELNHELLIEDNGNNQ